MSSVIENQRDVIDFQDWEYYRCATDINYFAEKYFEKFPSGELKIVYNTGIRRLFPDKPFKVFKQWQ